MAALGRHEGCFHPGDAATGDEHALAFARWQDLHAFQLPPDARIDGAAACLGGWALGHAREAAQAMEDLFGAIGHDFVGQLGIGEEGARHFDDVGFAAGDDLFHLRRIVQGADGGNWHADVLFDFGGEVNVAAVVGEHGRMGLEEAELIAAGGDVDEIDEIFDAVGDPAAFGEVVAAIEELGAAHAELDGKSGTDGFADACEHFARKAQAIFQAAAVFVGAMVEIWREELIDEPAVAAVDHDHLKTGALGEGGFFAVGLDDVGDLFFCQSFHRNAVWAGAVARSELTEAGFFILVDEIGAGVLTAVGKLDAWHGAVAFDAVGEIGEAGEEPWRLQIEVEHMGTVGGWMHDKLAGGDGGGAAFGAQLVEAWRAWTDAAIGGDVGAAHRRCKDAVAEGHLAEGDRAAQVWK